MQWRFPQKMKRRYCEVTDPLEINRILSSTNIGRLATSGADGYPYITPVNFIWREGKIYFHSAVVGRKIGQPVERAKSVL